MAERTAPRTGSTVAKIAVSVAAIAVGLFLVFGATTPAIADGVFVGSIALVLAVYLWSGVTAGQARVLAVVLVLVALYAFIRGFGVLELVVVRQVGGITAIVSGVILVFPFVRAKLAERRR
ncbi:hypothetical protein [Antiquaquibacter soli]|uniref:Uncharacterized protein n=1 Tax=Antiquaquibacter soli TaxID=3064523 RepID=A0ABT9BKF4_9MICO|nr:hypothetical protein [Protaetiibacter sp. WY-16]MDO7881495.1 hypothetical protein [Protaetiibacter sp. WY-16]